MYHPASRAGWFHVALENASGVNQQVLNLCLGGTGHNPVFLLTFCVRGPIGGATIQSGQQGINNRNRSSIVALANRGKDIIEIA